MSWLQQPLGKTQHPMCLGTHKDTLEGIVFECGYNTVIQCDECRYRSDKPQSYLTRGKNPAAKANRINDGHSEQLTLFPREPHGNE